MGDSPGAGEIGLRYLTTSARLRRTVDEHLARGGVSLAQTKILQVLARSGPIRQARLAVELGYAARSITQAVEAMERDGLVRRAADPADLRAKVVTVTEEGARALAVGEAAGDEILRQIFGDLGPDRLAALGEVLAVLDDATARVVEGS
ncbi:MarR family transcriptional regulator [Promicromonospora sp. MEB111]|uniref:MarR family winged helix-turn-helix transcriptional regulator n=1 Tax=Promicromonospora sp. MEB111 TaxID=3040301 RepID=UPI00254FF356|nr:MarR family transcriptional regulator [Promicromonospora sp. MEB111]